MLSGLAVRIDWATGQRDYRFSARTTDKERRNAIIEAMNYPNRVETTINSSDHPSIRHRELYGVPPLPNLNGKRGYYRPVQPITSTPPP